MRQAAFRTLWSKSFGTGGANIVRLRKSAGLSVADIQIVFGFHSPQAIYKWQSGAALPTVDNLIVLAALFGVRIDDILVTTNS